MKHLPILSFLLSSLFTSSIFSCGFGMLLLPNQRASQDQPANTITREESGMSPCSDFELNPELGSLHTSENLLENMWSSVGLPQLKQRVARRADREGDNRGRVVDRGKEGRMAPFLMSKQFSVGHIAVRSGTIHGPILGYLKEHQIVPTIDEAISYVYEVQGEVVGITALDSKANLGVVTGMFGQSLGPGLMNYHLSRHTYHSTRANDRPFNTIEEGYTLETTVFLMHQPAGELTVHWVNPDGNKLQVEIQVSDDRIHYIGDRQAFYQWLGIEATPVVYQWIEDGDITDDIL